jgi:hypothetical protein
MATTAMTTTIPMSPPEMWVGSEARASGDIGVLLIGSYGRQHPYRSGARRRRV